MYEVLRHAEGRAQSAGLLCDEESRAKVSTDEAIQKLLSQHTMVVGSTGNLGEGIVACGTHAHVRPHSGQSHT